MSLGELLAEIAEGMPEADLRSFAEDLAAVDGVPTTVVASALTQRTVPSRRPQMQRLVEAAQRDGVSGQSLSLAFSALAAVAAKPEGQSQLVWTGPATTQIPLRRTDEVLLQLIASARTELWVVSFALSRAERVVHALREATTRGVRVRILVESAEESEGRLSYDQIARLVAGLPDAKVYIWPTENRARNDRGIAGVVHAKCAVADRQRLFLSSANLTEAALTINMELGALLDAPGLATRAAEHFEALVTREILEDWSDSA